MPKPFKKRAPKVIAARAAAPKSPFQSKAAAPDDRRKTSERPSKQSQVIKMLQSTTGTTIAAVMKATGWQQHSVRGFLAGVVRKRLKLKLDSRQVGEQRVYRILSGTTGKARAAGKNRAS